MSFVLKRIYQGLLYRPESLQCHPLLGLMILVIQFVGMITTNNYVLGVLLLFIIIENICYGNLRGSLSILRAIWFLVLFLGGISYLFGGLIRMYQVVIRVLAGALGFSLFFNITNPSDLARSLEKLYLPPKLAMIPALALTFIPRIARDAEETYNTLMLRGEIKGRIWHWLPKVIAIFLASVLYRSEFLAQSLYYRGFGIEKRTHYRKVKFKLTDFIRLYFWIDFLLIYIFIDEISIFILSMI